VHSFTARKRHFSAAPQHFCLQKDFPLASNHLQLITSLLPTSQKADVRNSELSNWCDGAAADHRATANETVVATSSHWGAVMELTSPDILGDLHQGLAGLVNGVIETNIRTTQEMLRVTSHDEFVELQRRFFREYMAVLLCGSAQILDTIRRTAGQTAF
jgi:hypothetical protein